VRDPLLSLCLGCGSGLCWELEHRCFLPLGSGENLPRDIAPQTIVDPLPKETLETLTDFIEYSDAADVSVIESTVAWIQIHDSRVRAIVEANHDKSGTRSVVRAELEARILDAATIYAGAASFFNYARRRQPEPPQTLSWDAVGAALRNMQFWEDEHPRVYAILARHENTSTGPFERLAGRAN
jgi:hypothetical protein